MIVLGMLGRTENQASYLPVSTCEAAGAKLPLLINFEAVVVAPIAVLRAACNSWGYVCDGVSAVDGGGCCAAGCCCA